MPMLIVLTKLVVSNVFVIMDLLEMEPFVMVSKLLLSEYKLKCKFTSLTDIDECLSNIPPCSPNGGCYNTMGSYSCSCNSGYTGNGTHCIGRTEHIQPCNILYLYSILVVSYLIFCQDCLPL